MCLFYIQIPGNEFARVQGDKVLECLSIMETYTRNTVEPLAEQLNDFIN